ncbi:hypothetical protein [Modestobacter sp. SYSU DS0290]
MTTFVDLPTRTSPRPADVQTDLATLLELFSAADDDAADDAAPSPRRTLRGSGLRLRGRLQHWSRRAADWGAVPGTAAAWTTCPARVPVEAAP